MSVFGIGTDIVECDRIAAMIDKHDRLFFERVFTPREIDYCCERKASTQHFAGRWAAKEAVLKALGTGWAKGLTWTDIEIFNEKGGQPQVRLGGSAREWCEQRGITRILVSISHCQSYATAYATALIDE